MIHPNRAVEQTPPDCLPAALSLLAGGYWPVPLYPAGLAIRTKDGPRTATGKEPIGRSWGRTRPTEESLCAVYAAHPGAGVGLLLGPQTGAIDVEVDGPRGEESLRRLCGGEPPATTGWSSTRGSHRLYAWDESLAAVGKIKWTHRDLPDLEVRLGIGGQAQSACPPTPGTDGKPREWFGTGVEKLPDHAVAFILARLAQPAPHHVPPQRGVTPPPSGGLVVRATDPAAAWFAKALEGECGKVALAREGTRHDTLLAAARTLGGHLHHGYFTEAEAIAGLAEAARRCGLPEAEAFEVIRDGLEFGGSQPLPMPDRLLKPRTGNGPVVVEAEEPFDPVRYLRDEFPEPPDPAAYWGIFGEIVRLIEPETEADPVAVLVQLMLGYGNAVGRGPHIVVDGARHACNEFAVLVGDTAVGRKGTAWARAREPLALADPDWLKERVMVGLSSGEGVIHQVRDPSFQTNETGELVCVDQGVRDKRLLIVETEFGGALRVLVRLGNTLSPTLRQSFDGGDLRTMTRTSPLRATGPHISLVGHITRQELQTHLSDVEVFSGLGNRFLWLCVRRARILPDGGQVDAARLATLADRLRDAMQAARQHISRVERTPTARRVWNAHYERLTTPPPAMLGIVTARAAAHVLRLALINAISEAKEQIEEPHLHAALALWDYCHRSAAAIFGSRTGDRTADTIMSALLNHPGGLTRSELHNTPGRNRTAEDVNRGLAVLVKGGRVRRERVETGGRPSERWVASTK